MMRKLLFVALSSTFISFSAVPAQADGFFFGFFGNNNGITFYNPGLYYHTTRRVRQVLTPRQVRRVLRRQGYYDFRRISRRGNDYIVIARKQRPGKDLVFRMRVDGKTGRIERRRLARL